MKTTLCRELRRIASELTGMRKEATNYLYEYRVGDFIFYTKDRKAAGFRNPAGFAAYTTRYYRLAGDILGTDITVKMKKPQEIL